MSLLDAATLSGIRFYQRWLSPHKGFRCAHAAVHGGLTCSAAVAQIVREHGVLGGRLHVKARFTACRAAYGHILAGAPLALDLDDLPCFCCCMSPVAI